LENINHCSTDVVWRPPFRFPKLLENPPQVKNARGGTISALLDNAFLERFPENWIVRVPNCPQLPLLSEAYISI
jgi:hypothetical protein